MSGIFGPTSEDTFLREDYIGVESGAAEALFLGRSRWSRLVSGSVLGLTLSNQVQARITAFFDMISAAKSVGAIVWKKRHDHDEVALTLRSVAAVARWRERELREAEELGVPIDNAPSWAYMRTTPPDDLLDLFELEPKPKKKRKPSKKRKPKTAKATR